MKANQAAYDVGQLARHMARGYVTHIAAIRVVPRLSHKAAVQLIADYPSDFVKRKDGTKWSFDMLDALVDLADKAIAEELPRVWRFPATTAMRTTGTQSSRSHTRSTDSLSYSISWMRAMCSIFCFLWASTCSEWEKDGHCVSLDRPEIHAVLALVSR